uniref:Uncharacterized protein n=1 Tax=Candidatus Kentrum sp. SD TaxID=2126332 RepID=A0A450Z5P0_9GAMM|nr:MAG: hypothetical protein BECKSD772F_GA0070984_11591 [Candidatus Kentron sp. SD]VFK49101.1 MAG: hypothetical protein BECKSD772E_GA0070983_11582 [Candidatus Kentron sp. SD]VFK81297.1 MAG: hypothetical protein BECKSD772D_GA0070982_12941 [Candidatus Kentron sp. SD]
MELYAKTISGAISGWERIREGVGYVKDGNCFVSIDDYVRAGEPVRVSGSTPVFSNLKMILK